MPVRLSALLLTLALATPLFAHDGRRFEIDVIDGRLAARGYISSGVDDGGGLVRPYLNAIHDHWTNETGGEASARLPGFDLPDPGPLVGHTLTITFMDAVKWQSPPTHPEADHVPTLEPLGAGESVLLSLGSTLVSTDTPGRTLAVLDDIPSGGVLDVDPLYTTGTHPADLIVALRFELTTTAPGIAASESVYALLAPDGATPVDRLHHATLHLERYLGTPVPEPATGVGLLAGLLLVCRRRP